MPQYVNNVVGCYVFGSQGGQNDAAPVGNPTADTHHAFSTTATRMRFMAKTQRPDIVVRPDATFAGRGTFLVAAREGGPNAIRVDIQDAFCMVDLADDDSNFNLESEDHIEASTDKALDGDTNMTAGQASGKGNLEAIVVKGIRRSVP